MVAILDGRFAPDRIAHKAESVDVFVLFACSQIERCSIVWPSEMPLEPTE
jgi:hypothetical protein